MEFQIEHIDEATVILFPGDVLDANNSQEFKDDIAPLLKGNVKLVFDLSRMRFIDSSGCGALLSCLRKMKTEGGEFNLCSLSKEINAILRLMHLDRVFHIYTTKADAVKAISQGNVKFE